MALVQNAVGSVREVHGDDNDEGDDRRMVMMLRVRSQPCRG